jgi:L-amino acid N-acyltransferase YncA
MKGGAVMMQDLLKERYPKTMQLRDGTTVTIRPMIAEDEEALLTFFLVIPAEDRVFLKDDVTKAGVIQNWCKNLDYERVLPLVAEADGKIVGDATLHLRRGGWMRHAAKVRVVIDPAFRGKGLGSQIIKELITIAEHTDLEKLDVGLMAEQKTAISAFKDLGFVQVAVFPDHVKDLDGKDRDFVVLVRDLTSVEEIEMPF